MAAQVIVLKSGGRDADAYGFSNEGGDEDESNAPGATDSGEADGDEAGEGDEF